MTQADESSWGDDQLLMSEGARGAPKELRVSVSMSSVEDPAAAPIRGKFSLMWPPE